MEWPFLQAQARFWQRMVHVVGEISKRALSIPARKQDWTWRFFAIALAIRLGVLLLLLSRFGESGLILPPFSDAHDYTTIATNLLEGRGFSRVAEAPYIPDAKRVPLYPLFLSLTFALTGGSPWLASLLQAFASAVVVVLVYQLTRHVANERAARIAGAFMTVHPFAIFIGTQVLPETFFMLFFVSSFVLFLLAMQTQTHRDALLGGILIGIATLTKPAAQYLPLILTPFLAFRSQGLKRVSCPLIYIIGFALIVSPWILRNQAVTGTPMISYEANVALSLHAGGYRAFTETGQAIHFAEFRTEKNSDELLEASRIGYIKRLLRMAFADPIGFSGYLFVSSIPFVFGDGFVTMIHALSRINLPPWDFSTSAYAIGKTVGFGILPLPLLALSILSKIFLIIILTGALSGSIFMLRQNNTERYVVIATALTVLYFMLAGGPVQSARYRLPIDPLIITIAGVGISHLLSFPSPKKSVHQPNQ